MAVHLNRRTHSKSTLVPIKPVYRRSGRRVCACAAGHRVSAELCMDGLLYAGALARVHPKPSHTSAGIAANSVTYPAIGAKGGRIVGHTSADRSGSVEFGLRHHTSSGRSTPASDGCELAAQYQAVWVCERDWCIEQPQDEGYGKPSFDLWDKTISCTRPSHLRASGSACSLARRRRSSRVSARRPCRMPSCLLLQSHAPLPHVMAHLLTNEADGVRARTHEHAPYATNNALAYGHTRRCTQCNKRTAQLRAVALVAPTYTLSCDRRWMDDRMDGRAGGRAG